MPVYEFYCPTCNTIYNFFSRSVNTDKVPACPHCKTLKLQRRMSVFSVISPNRSEMEDNPLPMDESRMGKALEMLGREIEKTNEDDPKHAAGIMREFSKAAGFNPTPEMEEALGRMERGEDPEVIEAEMGDMLDGNDLFSLKSAGGTKNRQSTARVDETLYDL